METFPSKNISIAWVEKGSLTRNLFLSFGFAILTALSAQIRFELPFTPVPITAQTFVVILSGLLLGSRFGSFSMILYLLMKAGEAFILNPMDTPFIPTWSRVKSAIPDFLGRLEKVVNDDNKKHS